MHPTGVVVIVIVALVCLIECVCHRLRRQVVALSTSSTTSALAAVVGGTIEVVSSDPVRRR